MVGSLLEFSAAVGQLQPILLILSDNIFGYQLMRANYNIKVQNKLLLLSTITHIHTKYKKYNIKLNPFTFEKLPIYDNIKMMAHLKYEIDEISKVSVLLRLFSSQLR